MKILVIVVIIIVSVVIANIVSAITNWKIKKEEHKHQEKMFFLKKELEKEKNNLKTD